MYKVRFTSAALEQLEKLDKPISQQVFKKLKWLTKHFDESTPIPLTGNLRDIYKLRVGIIAFSTLLTKSGRLS